MVLLTEMVSSEEGIVSATTEDGRKVILEGCPQVDVVFGLNNKNDLNAKMAIKEIRTKALYDDSKFYWFPERDERGKIVAKFDKHKKTFAIPYAYFIK